MIHIGDRVKAIPDCNNYFSCIGTVIDIDSDNYFASVKRDDGRTGSGTAYNGISTWKIEVANLIVLSSIPQKTPEQIQAEPVTIGSDPEFLFLDHKTHRQIPACNVVHDGMEKQFGYDGHNSTGEIRPLPASDPLKHADNIRRLLLKARKDTQKAFTLDMVSATQESSIGGHIHIGHPLLLQSSDIQHKLQIALDSLLSFPLMYVENIDNAIHRKLGGSYGKLGDMRTAPWGIEYRSPASWLTSEKLTRGVLSLAYCIADDVIRHNHGISKPPAELRGFREAYNTHATDILKPLLAHAISEIHKLTLYPKYKTDIDYLLYHVKRGDDLQTGEIKRGWHIPYIHTRRIIFYTLMELIKAMSHEIDHTKNRTEYSTFISYSSNDYMIPAIAYRINWTLTELLEKRRIEPEQTTSIGIFAVHKKNGNVMYIQYNPHTYTSKKTQRLERIINDTCKAFRYTGLSIRLMPKTGYISSNMMRIGIGRPLREHKSYLSEILIFLCLCYANNTIYKTFKISKKTGKKINIQLLTSQLIKTITPLAKKTKKTEATIDDITAMDAPALTPTDMQRTYNTMIRETTGDL